MRPRLSLAGLLGAALLTLTAATVRADSGSREVAEYLAGPLRPSTGYPIAVVAQAKRQRSR